jgi:2-dehydro-3-deoxyglucarate aldolase
VVRVPAIEDVWIKKVMDVGVAGLMIPQVNSALDAAAAVRRSKFPPLGVRGVGVARANRYGARLSEYLADANAHSAMIVQVEHIDAVRNVEQIMDTDGVDAIFIGPYDLSASMGKAGQIADPEVQDAIARVRRACLSRKFPMGIFAGDAEAARQALDQGFTLVAVGAEVTLLANVASQMVRTLR